MMKHFLILTAAFFLVSSFCLQAGPISKVPFTITKPGKYFLIKNVSPAAKPVSAATAAITIQASNVELDLGGYNVIANPDVATITDGIAVLGGGDEVRVRNGRVSGFTTGISAHQAHHVLLEYLEVTSPVTGASLFSKGTRIRGCGFILTSVTGTGLLLSSSGGGPAHTVESCNFYATVIGVAATQIGLDVEGAAPTVARDCQFIGLGQGIVGNGVTSIANNLFRDCGASYSNVATAAGFNQ